MEVGNKRPRVVTINKAKFKNIVLRAIPTDLWNMIIEKISTEGIQKLLEADVVYFNELIQKNGASFLCLALEFRKQDDIKKARRNLLKAVQLASPDAMLYLALAYFDGGWGIAENTAKAIYWFSTLAECGNLVGAAFFARCLKTGFGVSKSLERSNEWAQKILAANWEFFAKGYCYLHGVGTTKNIQDALVNMLKDRDGREYQQFIISKIFRGLRDTENAYLWCTKAAEQGYCMAQFELSCYLGKSGHADEAAVWLKKAHNQGFGMRYKTIVDLLKQTCFY